jgi:hypothetical protein
LDIVFGVAAVSVIALRRNLTIKKGHDFSRLSDKIKKICNS